VQTRVEKIKQGVDGWSLHLHDKRSNKKQVVGASVVVNAAGPWARKVLDESGLSSEGTPSVRLVKGSHIIIPRHFEGDQCYILQQPDKRIVFAIPYEGKYTLIGTTEVAYHDDPYEAKITDEEIGYLCDAASRFLKKPVTRSDVEWSYSGVRPLFDDGSKNATSATRDYHVHVQGPATAPLYSVFGGKLTTYRIVAEDVVNRVMRQRNELVRPWTAEAHLPGGDIKNADFERFYEDNMARYPWLPEDLLLRYLRAYGTKIADIIMGGKTLEDLGRCFGDGVYEAEVRYLVRREWAREAEDILWRRSKLGLHVGGKTVTSLSLALPEIVKDEVGE
jgi:glycerol-3-phosphate dehydrogenase